MRCRSIKSGDESLISEWNRQLQIEEGASVMDLAEIEVRLQRWLSADCDALVFELRAEPIGYALYRPMGADRNEPRGVYLRQFFIARAHRRHGRGSTAIRLFLDEVVQGRRLVLEALNSNPAGQAFWRSVGMREYSVTFELDPDAA